jgi:O-antigen ligase
MAKRREQINMSAGSAAVASATPPAEWWTQIAFVLAVALVLVRATMGDFSKTRNEPMTADTPRAAGAATMLALDLLCCLPAILVLARRVMDREYVLRWSWAVLPLGLLAVWGVMSAGWAADRFMALMAGFHLVAATAMLWAASQLVRSWLRFRMVGAVMVGLLLAYFTYALFYKTVDLPDLKRTFERDKAEILKERGLADDPFLAKQFENRVMSGELMAYFVSPNTMAAMVVLLGVIAVGMAGQRLTDDRRDRAGAAMLLTVPLAVWMIYLTNSRTAYGTPLIAAALLGGAWYARGWLARNAGRAFWGGVAVVVVVFVLVIAHGMYRKTLFHESLTFRWYYWWGSMRIAARHLLAGVGLDNFGYYYLGARLPWASEEIKDPHNFLVKFLVELGVVGLVLCVAWLGRLAWEVTRPVEPPQVGGGGASRVGPRAIASIATIVGVALGLNVMASVDFNANAWFVFMEILRKVAMYALMLIGASVAAVRSFDRPELDARPAPFLLYAVIVALAVFLVHNLVDFSLFEPGPMMLYAFVAGCVLGVRQPSVAGRRKRTAAAAVALGVGVVAWLIVAGFVWIPTATAEDAANDAGIALRSGRAAEAVRLYAQAREHQRMNADYTFRTAQAMLATGPTANGAEILALLDSAVRRNPMSTEYLLTRARFTAHLNDAAQRREAIKADYRRVLELNPNEVSLRLEFAEVLKGFGTAEDRAAARREYGEALRFNGMLRADEPKRLKAGRVEEIRKEMGAL